MDEGLNGARSRGHRDQALPWRAHRVYGGPGHPGPDVKYPGAARPVAVAAQQSPGCPYTILHCRGA